MSDLSEASSELQPNFAVGFDVTIPYGTAAVSFSNGTTVKVARVAADNDYIEMFQRLSLESSRHPSRPYKNIGEAWDDMPRQWLRDARKAIRLAASPDVARLAKMIADLRTQVEEQTGVRINSACVSTMHLAALYYEDLHDAFEYLGLNYISYHSSQYVLYETTAASAGLCSNYKDHDGCNQDQADMPRETVISVLYTRNVLAVSLANFTLGYDARTTGEKEYWDAVGLKLDKAMFQNGYRSPDKVLLLGDCTDDENFQSTLKKAFRIETARAPEIFSKDEEGVAAKGAAEFAKRRPYAW